MQKAFAYRAAEIWSADPSVIGLAVGGSWLTGEIDEYSDLDLVLVTKEKISDDKAKMLEFAGRIGDLLSGFTGEHIGEPRVLICLYDNPLLHVDIKFVTLDEFRHRVEDPVILHDTDGQLRRVIEQTPSEFPFPGFQWIEDRFWIWVHYILLKIGRGEYAEAFDSFAFLRGLALGPLVQIKNGNLPRGVRKVETQLAKEDFVHLKATFPQYSRASLLESLRHSVSFYRQLRSVLFPKDIALQSDTEQRVMEYFEEHGRP